MAFNLSLTCLGIRKQLIWYWGRAEMTEFMRTVLPFWLSSFDFHPPSLVWSFVMRESKLRIFDFSRKSGAPRYLSLLLIFCIFRIFLMMALCLWCMFLVKWTPDFSMLMTCPVMLENCWRVSVSSRDSAIVALQKTKISSANMR